MPDTNYAKPASGQPSGGFFVSVTSSSNVGIIDWQGRRIENSFPDSAGERVSYLPQIFAPLSMGTTVFSLRLGGDGRRLAAADHACPNSRRAPSGLDGNQGLSKTHFETNRSLRHPLAIPGPACRPDSARRDRLFRPGFFLPTPLTSLLF